MVFAYDETGIPAGSQPPAHRRRRRSPAEDECDSPKGYTDYLIYIPTAPGYRRFG
jgi:hypothetical protein